MLGCGGKPAYLNAPVLTDRERLTQVWMQHLNDHRARTGKPERERARDRRLERTR